MNSTIQSIASAATINTVGDGNSDLSKDVTNILNGVIAVLGLVCVVVMIVGGVNYMTSNGDTGKVEKGKKTILYALVLIAVLALVTACGGKAQKAEYKHLEPEEAEEMIAAIRRKKRWRQPSLERFLYDFLEQIVDRDLSVMERYEKELNHIEDTILSSREQEDLVRVNEIRGDIRELLVHYEQIIDMTQELEENENGFFSEENLRYIHLFMNLMARRHDSAVSLRDHTMQVRDLYNAQLEVRQNRTMTLLTVITTIFMPLTLIAGWYGMNFRYMPELEWRFGYLIVFLVSVAIVIFCLILFRKKKWL